MQARKEDPWSPGRWGTTGLALPTFAKAGDEAYLLVVEVDRIGVLIENTH